MDSAKISIITANLNGAAYLEKTILSVLNQNYPSLEYIIIDGGSTDNSLDIINKYKDKLTYFISEPDNGLYDALQKGFKKSSGEIMMWINSDDLLHPHAFLNIHDTFEKFPNVRWITGINTFFNTQDRVVGINKAKKWSKYDYYLRNYKWIQQESTAWKRDLWNEAGALINKNYKLAGDLELWTRFFKYEKLYSCSFLIGGFRVRPGEQLSSKFHKIYNEEAWLILNSEIKSLNKECRTILNTIIFYEGVKKTLKRTIILESRLLIKIIDHFINKLKDYPPIIRFNSNTNNWETF